MKKVLVFTFLILTGFVNAQINNNNNDQTSNYLSALNSISVTIGGEFIVNGSFIASKTERLDQFITRIYNTSRATLMSAIRDDKSMKQFQKKYDKFALRNIELIRRDGTKLKIDLAEFRLTGNFKHNPYLKEGDLIVFPAYDIKTNFVSVTGAVNKEITFQYVEGDNLQTALFFARGINKAYSNVTKAEITRLTNNGRKEENFEVDLDSDFALKPGDRIRVLFDQLNNYNYRVLVLGEVNKPGYVPIAKHGTTLKEVIEKAGGFTENASLKFAQIVRSYDSFNALRKKVIEAKYDEIGLTPEEEEKLLDRSLLEKLRMYRAAILKREDTLFFSLDNQLRLLESNSTLDFTQLASDSSYESNYVVKDGDVIVIPEKVNYVYVWGGVPKVGYYEFNKDFTVWDYIALAGGFTEIASGEDYVYLIKGKTRNWLKVEPPEREDGYVIVPKDLTVEPGDYIYVKKEPPLSFGFYLGRVGAIAGIIGSIATIILLLVQFGK